MPMIAGSVDGSGAGTGFAKEMFDLLDAATDYGAATGAGLAAAKAQVAVICNAAATMIDHVKTASVSTTDSGVGPPAWTGTGTGTVA